MLQLGQEFQVLGFKQQLSWFRFLFLWQLQLQLGFMELEFKELESQELELLELQYHQTSQLL